MYVLPMLVDGSRVGESPSGRCLKIRTVGDGRSALEVVTTMHGFADLGSFLVVW